MISYEEIQLQLNITRDRHGDGVLLLYQWAVWL